jgi:transitional endoplasmic reticulum ATPase
MMSEAGVLSLRVAEALPRDAGRGLARIDPREMQSLAAQPGDVVQIRARRSTVARAMPAFPDDRGKGLVQIDGITRSNAQAALGDKVQLSVVTAKPAAALVLAPAGAPARDTRHLGRLLEGLAVTAGDRVRATLFGAQRQEFLVLDTVPKGPVLVQASTELRVKHEPSPSAARVSYEDIGGLHKEVQRVREMVELPLRFPELFRHLGIEPPKGILLHGPPGTGKTLIARAVASETDAYFVSVNGPEIIHKFYGESEARLRQVFEESSRHAPSVIFLDEIDAIAPKRAEVTGEVEKRVVAQLLALMDGLEQRGEVFVIAATNIPDSLDPALRRPGRFDREVALRVPDRQGRLEILQIHTRGMPLVDDVDLEALANITHGFVGADLAALCREAAMSCLRRFLPGIDLSSEILPDEQMLSLRVQMRDFLEALREVEPSAIRDVAVEVPDVRWEDVGGLEEAKQELREMVEWPFEYPALFERVGSRPARGILMHGPPGTGKTLLARAVATESQANFISVKGPALMSKWLGESEKGVRETFRRAKQVAPCIVFFDEIDALAPARSMAADSRAAERVVSQLLTEMDGIEELSGVCVLAATNRVDLVDPALLRPGRFDFLLELPMPDRLARQTILQIQTRGKPLAADVSLSNTAAATEGMSGADLAAICRRASMLAIREWLQKRHPEEMARPEIEEQALTGLEIAVRHFRAAIAEMKKKTGEGSHA